MATNKLRPESDLATREFFTAVTSDEKYLQDSPAHRRQIIAILLEALNYMVLPNWAFVSRDANVSMQFGSSDYSRWPNEWEADEEVARAAIEAKNTPEASTSSEAEDTEVRESVLPEDVR